MRRGHAAVAWVGSSVLVGSLLGHALLYGDRSVFLPGATTSGHYQIEDRCELCHTPMMGVAQDACTGCHADDLERSDDSHPRAKFLDPRNADRVAAFDARRCVTCHVEHRPEITRAMGVTQPVGFCRACHADIADERASHAGLAFVTCASIGCHEFHDNRGLSEEFLSQHLDDADTDASARPPERTLAARIERGVALARGDADAPASEIVAREWSGTAHAAAGVNCTDCHAPDGAWLDRPSYASCTRCHEDERRGFERGRHGMRMAVGASPMRPDAARAAMRDGATGEVTCVSCHGAHSFDTEYAATRACLQCHADDHSRAHVGSAHDAAGVTCASCHLPRESRFVRGARQVFVVHDQNANLRPRDKMLRSACATCHGVGFALDALADEELVGRAFRGAPAHHIETMDMVRRNK